MTNPPTDEHDIAPVKPRWWHWLLMAGLGFCFYGFIAGAVFQDRSGFASFLFGTGMLLTIASGLTCLVAWLLKLSATTRSNETVAGTTPPDAHAAARWRKRIIVGLATSPILGVIGCGIAFLGLGIGFRGHSGDTQSGPIIMCTGIGIVVVSLLTDVVTIMAGALAWRRGSAVGWLFLSLAPLLLKALAVVIVALAS